MTDAEYIMRSEARAHKANGRAIYNRASRGGGKSCRLPSDNLTNAQWKKKNGEVTTIKLNKPMEWSEFKVMNRDCQITYLDYLTNYFYARQKDIANMLGVSREYFAKHLKRNQIDLDYKWQKKSPHEKWLKFISEGTDLVEDADTGNITINKEPVIEENIADEPVLGETNDNANDDYDAMFVNTTHGNISFVGDPYAVFAKAVKLFDEKKHYVITISFREEEENAQERD